MKGSVLLFNNQQGWGFIRGSDNKDYFVHYSNIETDRKRNLSEEDIVSFEVGIGTNGKKQALHVQPILTYKMVKKALKDEGYHIKPIKDQYNINKYIVVCRISCICWFALSDVKAISEWRIYKIDGSPDRVSSYPIKILT